MRIRDEALSWQQLDDEIVVLDLASSNYLKLNGSGALLWLQLVDGADRDGLVQALTSEYDVEDERAAADVDAFLERLREAGLAEDSPV